MKHNGAVVCFHKYIGGKQNLPDPLIGPVCLGYFGQAFVSPVECFEDYLKLASTDNANLSCSRKQLLLYKLSDSRLSCEIEFRTSGSAEALPFVSNEKDFALCSCTVINLNKRDGIKPPTQLDAAQRLYGALSALKNRQFRFAITGLLGVEDLCLLLLADRYAEIQKAIASIQTVCAAEEPSKHLIDNAHSILMVDTRGLSKAKKVWGDAKAAIHFSIKTAGALPYLHELHKKLESSELTVPQPSQLVEQLGEFDATLTCPAQYLSDRLYCKGGLFRKEEHRRWIYQTETTVFLDTKAGKTAAAPSVDEADQISDVPPADEIDREVEQAIREINDCFNPTRDQIAGDTAGDIALTISRLQKDYHRIESYPYVGTLRQYFREQFIAVLRTLVVVARTVSERKDDMGRKSAYDEFYDTMDEVVVSFEKSMQAIDHSDRLGFHEQTSNLWDTGSYYKVLCCYYGIVNEILTLLKSVWHEPGSEQYNLIPMLSFGLTPIPISFNYECTALDNESKDMNAIAPSEREYLISITLPYQALSNPAKYLGILVHELFHYVAPSGRAKRNGHVADCLIRAALSEFLSLLADGSSVGEAQFGQRFYEDHRDWFIGAAEDMREVLYNKILEAIGMEVDAIRCAPFTQLLQDFLAFDKEPSSFGYQFYSWVWKNLRSKLIQNMDACTPEEKLVFALHTPPADLGIVSISRSAGKRVFALHAPSEDIGFSELVQKVPYERLAQLTLVLEQCSAALAELRPDLFSIRAIGLDRTPERRLLQYFWQLYHFQKLIGLQVEQPEGTPAFLDALTSRFGMIAEHLLSDAAFDRLGATLDHRLTALLSGSALFSKRNAFTAATAKDFRTYLSFSRPFAEAVEKLCKLADSEFPGTPACKKIVERLTEEYCTYFTTLEELERGASVQEQNNKMFELCRSIVEHYSSCDPTEVDLASPPPETADSSEEPKPLEFVDIASDPADIPYCIRRAFRQMRVNGKDPVLWYRGQTNYKWLSLPNIMRIKKQAFLPLLKTELKLVKLETALSEFGEVEWLGYLQHYHYKTNLLDFSENLHIALYFATADWDEKNKPAENAIIKLFNPILFNLAMEALEKNCLTSKLAYYLTKGEQSADDEPEPPLFEKGEPLDAYAHLFSFASRPPKKGTIRYPRAAYVCRSNERIAYQNGHFVFYDLYSKPNESESEENFFAHLSLERLQEDFLAFCKRESLTSPPFLYDLELNCNNYLAFKEYLSAAAVVKSGYPELSDIARRERIFRRSGLI